MAAEPINIFSHRVDPRGVLAVLRRLAPDLKVDGPDDDWATATVAVGRKGLFRKPATLTFRHDRTYYDGPDWPRQRDGMQGYFARFPAGDDMPRLMRTIASFRFALATSFEPDRTDDDDDDRMRFVEAVARHLDGCVFMPSGLYDPQGRPLAAADGEYDPEATWPQLPPTADHPDAGAAQQASAGGAADDAEGEDEPEMNPPSPERVARRALALAAVAGRALLEQEDLSDPGVEDTRRRLLAWVDEAGIGDELEPEEWKVLQRPAGQLEQQDALNATWRIEGLGVLAWALNRYDLPPHDELVNPGALLPSVGILDADRARALVSEPPLWPAGEIEVRRKQLFTVHWRMVNYRLKPEAMDFAEFCRTAWFADLLDPAGLRLVDGDLALGDLPIHRAGADAVGTASSAAMERHKAIHWLAGYSEVYSETDVST